MHIKIQYADGQQDCIADTDLGPFRDVLLTLAEGGGDAILAFFQPRQWPVEDVTIDSARAEITLHFFDPAADYAAAARWMST